MGGPNPIQIEIKDDRILNTLKKYKNVIYSITPLSLLFPASVKTDNDTKQIFVTCRELNDIKKALINGKIYGLLSIIDLNKIDNWQEIKGQLTWISAAFKDQKEINNNSHICFPFATKSLNDLVSFSIYLIDVNNKEISFTAGEKKMSILNFQIHVFLR